jgi:LuxR family transcriptional regulator, quorum-sensing system regulator CciR
MEPFDIAEGFIELCQSEKPPASSLASGFQKATEALGFRHFACCARVDPLRPPPQAIMIHNYPADWVQHYSREKLYEIDPVLCRAECNPMPFMWDTTFQIESITAAQAKMLVDASEFGITHGFTIPIHLSWLPGALRASCSIVPDASTVGRRNYFIVETMVTGLYAALNRAHPPRRETTGIELSHRERQCLSLAAQGKDDWAIGRLLGLSPKTVHSYMKRLMQRIGMRTRVQVIVWALETAQITFGDVQAAISPDRPAQ